ncbi:hypothetical protein Trco_004053 [Trichoderma cornu-damae]|uniref:Uncharacterized protein n=1 Tax=Trichoderma cornu-damae TaxID=654480 RepID=A0A9P8QQD0_9HYPO|nr:hypothetical protein Trco_004053 [Trichoderma cornu-damae]
MSTTGSRIARAGSNKPQFASSFLARAAASMVSGGDWSALLFLPFFLGFAAPFPLVDDRGRVDTAAFKAANRSLQYSAWPSLTFFSMVPRVRAHVMQLTCTRVALFSAHERQYLVLTRNMLPLGTSGFCVATLTLAAFSKSRLSTVSVTMHLVCFGPMGALRGLIGLAEQHAEHLAQGSRDDFVGQKLVIVRLGVAAVGRGVGRGAGERPGAGRGRLPVDGRFERGGAGRDGAGRLPARLAGVPGGDGVRRLDFGGMAALLLVVEVVVVVVAVAAPLLGVGSGRRLRLQVCGLDVELLRLVAAGAL